MPDVEILLGETLSDVIAVNDEMTFNLVNGKRYKLYHEQDCCEDVHIEDITGDLNDLIGSPLLMAEKVTNSDSPISEYDESYTWTFYKFATINGYVTIRWYGTSNGYYSESVDFEEVRGN